MFWFLLINLFLMLLNIAELRLIRCAYRWGKENAYKQLEERCVEDLDTWLRSDDQRRAVQSQSIQSIGSIPSIKKPAVKSGVLCIIPLPGGQKWWLN